MIITRFAPSPTGYLHIGGARTALFNYLFTRHHGGKFHLRIEDTDRARSTTGAIEAIIDGMQWLGLDHDDEIIYQFARAPRHAEVAHQLVKMGRAYYCYASPDELAELRAFQEKNKLPIKYDGRWRDKKPSEAPAGVQPVVRLKMPNNGDMIINDLVYGEIRVAYSQLDDMVLLRSDGTPTYMLSVVVDDHDMGITHIIRGSDHQTNAFRQRALFEACEWQVPHFAHIPLINGPDGAKLSKRHGALGVGAYRDMGYLPWAINNAILRLGWSHGDDEIISKGQAIDWFGDLSAINKSAARMDFAKMENINGHYIAQGDDEFLVKHILSQSPDFDANILGRAMPFLKGRAKTLVQLAEQAQFLLAPQPINDAKLQAQLVRDNLAIAHQLLSQCQCDDQHGMYDFFKEKCQENGYQMGKIAGGARLAVTGMGASPGFFECCVILGRAEILQRLHHAMAGLRQ